MVTPINNSCIPDQKQKMNAISTPILLLTLLFLPTRTQYCSSVCIDYTGPCFD